MGIRGSAGWARERGRHQVLRVRVIVKLRLGLGYGDNGAAAKPPR